MARGRYKLKRDLEKEQGQIQRAGRKRGLWGSIGGTLLGGLAMAVTGGAASPLVAGLFAGGAKFAGGHLGNLLAGKTKGGKLTGGKFFQGEREALASQIKENIGAKAAKAGITAGMLKMGGALKYGKEGFSVSAAPGAIAGKTTEKAAGAPSLYGPGEGGLSKLLDFRGSAVGKGLSKMQAAGEARALRASQMEALSEPGTYGGVIDMKQIKRDVLRNKAVMADPIKESAIRGKPELFSPSGVLKEQTVGEMQYKTPTAKGFAQRLFPGGESGYQTDVPLGKGLAEGERIAYDKINKMTEAGYPPVHPMDRTKTGYYSLPEEFGEGFIDTKTGETVRPPGRPDVEMPSLEEDIDIEFPVEDTTIEDTEMAGFDEALWKKGEEQLRSWDFQRDVGFAKEHPGLYPDQNLMDKVGKPSLDIPLEVTPKVEGRGGVDHEKFYAGVSPEELRRGPIVQARSTMEQIDLPRKSPLLTGQNIKTHVKRALEGIFKPPEIYQQQDILRTPGYGFQGPPEKLGREMVRTEGPGVEPPQFWKNLWGDK